MAKIISTLILSFIAFSSSTRVLDLGVPTIQAICKVTLTDDRTIEGIITFGSGGYEYNYKPNGFCFVHDRGVKQFILYGFDFQGLTPNSFGAFRRGTSKLYYANNLGSGKYPEKTTEFDSTKSIVTITTTEIDQFELSDQMVMYDSLPLALYVGYKDSESYKLTVNTNEIKSVKILKQPSQKWLDLIENARLRINEAQKEEYWTDYMEPAWYHEIIENKDLVEYLKKYF